MTDINMPPSRAIYVHNIARLRVREQGTRAFLSDLPRESFPKQPIFSNSLLKQEIEDDMIAKNEIEARMRWTHGSRQAGNVGRANPPNFPPGHGRGVGPWGIPMGLSAGDCGGAIR